MSGLVEGLLGARNGEKRDVRTTFPSNLKDKELAGKEVIFEVTVLAVDERVVPPVDEDFAKMVRPNQEGFDLAKLKEELRKAVDEEGADREAIMKSRDSALEAALLATLSLAIPPSLVTTRVREKFALMLTEMRDNGTADKEIQRLVTPENFEKYRELTKEDVERDLKAR